MKNQAMYDGLIERRSIRSFKPEQVSDEDLQAVLKAGTYAPTAMGAQAPIIIAVQNPEDVKALNALNAVFGAGSTPYYGAPTVLLILTPQGNAVGTLDGASVATTLLNAAHAVGLGACWINRAQLMFQTNGPCSSAGASRAAGTAWPPSPWAIPPARLPSPSPGRKTISTSSSEVYRFGGRDRDTGPLSRFLISRAVTPCAFPEGLL